MSTLTYAARDSATMLRRNLVRLRRDGPSHHPVPGGGRPARRPGGAARPRPHRRRRHAGRTEAAARALGGSTPDDDALTLQVPSDGGVRSLRGLLDQLDRASIEVDSLSVHTPDLDDVFFAFTGHPDAQKDSHR